MGISTECVLTKRKNKLRGITICCVLYYCLLELFIYIKRSHFSSAYCVKSNQPFIAGTTYLDFLLQENVVQLNFCFPLKSKYQVVTLTPNVSRPRRFYVMRFCTACLFVCLKSITLDEIAANRKLFWMLNQLFRN